MAKQYLSSQEILFRCFEDKTGQLRTSNGPYALQDYLNAVFDENTNSLRISSVVNSIVVPSEQLSLLAEPKDGQLIKLTTEDDELFAPAGLYFYYGDGWVCLNCNAPYDLGNLGATPSLSLIPGAAYTANVDVEITTFTVAFTRPGRASITLTNASEYAIAQPTMAGRTSKPLAGAAWDGVATTLSKALLEDDGVYLVAGMITLSGEIDDPLSTKVDKVAGKGLSTNDLTDELLETLEGSEQTSNKATTLDTPDNTKYPSTLAVSTALNGKVDKVTGKGLSTNDLTDELMDVISGAEQQGNKVDTLLNPGAADYPSVIAVNGGLSTKVDKVTGKALSTNDLTDELLETLEGSEQTSNKATTLDTPDNTKYPSTLAVSTALNGKVDKVTGKGLSDNNYTTGEKNKLASALTSLPNATTEAKGIIELATEAEVTAGTLTDRAVVPSTLKVELDKKVDKVSVTALPASPVAGQMIRLTTADDTAKAAPGVYMHDGVSWTCVSYSAAYALGNLGATPSLTLIPGASYTATVDVEITTFTVAFTRPGLVSITITNADTLAIAQPAMAGRTSKLLAEGAWDGAATALSKALVEDDGTYLIVSAGGLV